MVKFPGNVIYCLVLMAQIDPLLGDTKGFNGKKHVLCHDFSRLQTATLKVDGFVLKYTKNTTRDVFLLSIKEGDSYWNYGTNSCNSLIQRIK